MPESNSSAHDITTSQPPVFKWPGGKRSLVASIESLIDRKYDRLVEPFCGSAALFFHLTPKTALLADRNVELINAYIQIRDQVDDLMKKLDRMSNSENSYYKIRSTKPRTDLNRAARLIYLMRLSFNGIYRENLRGEFNVPYGYKIWQSIYDESKLRAASLALKDVELKAQTFNVTMKSLRENDLIYIDPPYTVSHNNNGFIKYNQTLFSWNDQKKLAASCEKARQRGSLVVVSNADHQELRALYPEFEYHQVKRFCSISGLTNGRRHVTEAIFIGKSL